MNLVKKLQDQLIAHTKDCFNHEISNDVIEAFRAVPRHKFIKQYKLWKHEDWVKVTSENLQEQLPILYSDTPLIIYGDSISTISQPTLVLKMLDLLQIKKGQIIFELGTGSGWNAALMGYLVGPKGKVISTEIIPELAQQAKKTIKSMKLNQVKIIQGDGGLGYKKLAPYDRVIFTAGSYELPRHFFNQIKKGGLLLFVLKNDSKPDILFLLEKKEDYFESLYSLACGFVPMTGKYQGIYGTQLPELLGLKVKIYLADKKVKLLKKERLLKRSESKFVWSEDLL